MAEWPFTVASGCPVEQKVVQCPDCGHDHPYPCPEGTCDCCEAIERDWEGPKKPDWIDGDCPGGLPWDACHADSCGIRENGEGCALRSALDQWAKGHDVS